MIVKNAKYELTAVKPEQYPQSGIPEIAFVGRSNVGKSSIINTLLNRKNLARVGATPGKTREINFYNVDEKLYFVDLPGYGYANVSKEKKTAWGDFVEGYLATRKQLRLLILMVDIRHSPSEDDRAMREWIMENNVPFIVVASKSDKITRSQLNGKLNDIRKALDLPQEGRIIPFSSVGKQGVNEVWGVIDAVINS